ncbi:hypothetical protein LZ017_00065 [Pelomonas sp. CA6]|uniref:hypothetical protein n=1 Tax=Pelomonas sp. CA6 TaxID=2907999 RepID=UPI001F4BBB6E|nr:hypothetical protein [Pelomonas sp. CA6]MCH7341781.1 hypothetical protein [Pelomonas sp. CA6]
MDLAADTLPLLNLAGLDAELSRSRLLTAFEHLAPGQAMDLGSDADPAVLEQALAEVWPRQYSWVALPPQGLQGRVRVTRKAAGGCCGCCGGQ